MASHMEEKCVSCVSNSCVLAIHAMGVQFARCVERSCRAALVLGGPERLRVVLSSSSEPMSIIAKTSNAQEHER
jgi:hypothetical protein